MIVTASAFNSTYPVRANSGQAAPEQSPAPAGHSSFDAKKVAFAALPFSDGPDQRQNNFDVLTRIAQNSADPIEKVIAQTAADAGAERMYPTTAVAVQSAALEKLSQGAKAPIGLTLAEIGLKGFAAAQDPGESRRLGGKILEAIAAHSQNPSEVVFAKAARQGAGMKIFDQTGANLIKNALEQIKAGVNENPAVAVGQLGQTLPQVTQSAGEQALGESCNIGMALFSSLAADTQNKTAKALTEMSSGHATAGDGLRQAQQEAFANLVSGQESRFTAPTEERQYLTSNKDALTCALGGAATQLGMMALGSAGLHGLTGMLAGMLIGVVAFGGVKAVYHGMMEVNARKTGPRRYDEAYVKSAFADGASAGFKGNILRSLIHSGINGAAYSFLGPPASLVVGPGVSAALAKFTGL